MGQCIIMTNGYAGNDSSDCTASKSQVLSGYTAITKDSNDDAIVGNMPERGAWTGSVGMNGSVIIPDGHHNGSGKVNGPSVTQRGAWTSGLGINGKAMIPEGYHNGQGYVNQSIATMGGQTITPSATQQTVATSGKYMTGNVVINGVNIFHKINAILIFNREIAEGDSLIFNYTVPSQYHYNSLLFGLTFNGGANFQSRGIANKAAYTSKAGCIGGRFGWVEMRFRDDYTMDLAIHNSSTSPSVFKLYLLGGFDDAFDPTIK